MFWAVGTPTVEVDADRILREMGEFRFHADIDYDAPLPTGDMTH